MSQSTCREGGSIMSSLFQKVQAEGFLDISKNQVFDRCMSLLKKESDLLLAPSTLPWQEELTTGSALIDRGHKTTVAEINDIRLCDKNALTDSQIDRICRSFGGHILDQFHLEEDYMQKYQYYNYDKHKEEHMRLLKTIQCLKKLFQEERSSMLLLVAIEFDYMQWLVRHIREFDRELVAFMKIANPQFDRKIYFVEPLSRIH